MERRRGGSPLPASGRSRVRSDAMDDQRSSTRSRRRCIPTPYSVSTSPPATAVRSRRRRLTFDPTRYRTERVFVVSKDGTRVPVFITHHTGLKKDGANPAMLYGFGGFGLSDAPQFRPEVIAFLERGGVYATAQHPRRRRVRSHMARGGHVREEAERVRRFHRGSGVSRRGEVRIASDAGHHGRIERRAARRRRDGAAPRPVRRGSSGRRCVGHAAVSEPSGESIYKGEVRSTGAVGRRNSRRDQT